MNVTNLLSCFATILAMRSLGSLQFPKAGELPELDVVNEIRVGLAKKGRYRVLAEVVHAGKTYPIPAFHFGTNDVTAPALLIVGGVHGLERIGCHVVLSFLQATAAQLEWDRTLIESLSQSRIIFVPLLNPIGTLLFRRGNGNGVDLMRNGPDHPDGWGTPLVGGHRLSPRLPWFRGRADQSMQPESEALCSLFAAELCQAEFVLSLDIHSGFGVTDRLWFPYARTRQPIAHLPELLALKAALDASLPAHVYVMEPQARNYTAQGDLWDHLYDLYCSAQPSGVFLPLTLEMGSWSWLRKNPRQLFSLLGGFNPLVPHRFLRILRRHQSLLQFLQRVTHSTDAWLPGSDFHRSRLREQAMHFWYSAP